MNTMFVIHMGSFHYDGFKVMLDQDSILMNNLANLLTAGTSFKGETNEKAKKMFNNKNKAANLGQLTDYSVLEQYNISVHGDSPPEPIEDWSVLEKSLQNALLSGGFAKPTPIQHYSFNCYVQRRPLIAISPTGSGKTLAYALPILHLLNSQPVNELRCIVLVPTRELASQVFRQFRRFSESSATRVQLLRKNRDTPKCQVMIATPKRFLVAKVNLDLVQFVVIDEADHLLAHSFVAQTDAVLALVPKDTNVHVSLYSATMNPKVEETARSFMPNPIRIQVGDDHAVAALITQELKFVGVEKGKVLEIKQRIQNGELQIPAIIFVMNKQRAFDLAGELGYPSAVLTSEESDTERAEAIRRIRTGAAHFLITTDLGGRGIDLATIQTVINFDLPPDSTTYIHRIGRTARAGRAGFALTLFTTDDQPNLKPVASVLKKHGYEIEDWMVKNPDKQHRGARALFEPSKRHTISSKVWKNAKVRNPNPKLPPNVD